MVGFPEISMKVCKNASMQVFWVQNFRPKSYLAHLPSFCELVRYVLLLNGYDYVEINLRGESEVCNFQFWSFVIRVVKIHMADKAAELTLIQLVAVVLWCNVKDVDHSYSCTLLFHQVHLQSTCPIMDNGSQVTLVLFVWLFFTMCFQMCPQANYQHEKMRIHIGCICLVFLHYVFLNVKCVLKLTAREVL